jgi:hypothetical protein
MQMTRITVKAVRAQWAYNSIRVAFAIQLKRARVGSILRCITGVWCGCGGTGSSSCSTRCSVGSAISIEANVRDFGKNARRTADPYHAGSTGDRAPVTTSGRASAAALRRKARAGITIKAVGSCEARDAIGVTGQVKLRGAGIQ